MNRRRIQVTLFVVLLVATFLVWWFRATSPWNAPPEPTYLGVPEQRSRIDGMIAQLRAETLDESIAELFEPQQYTYPNYYSNTKLLDVDFERMLSARRALKVLWGIESLSPESQPAKCRELFDICFQMNAERQMAVMTCIEEEPTTSPARSWNETRLPLCLALYATARYASPEDLRDQLGRLEEFRRTVETRLIDKKDSYDDLQKEIMLGNCTPSPRAQLIVVVTEAARHMSDADIRESLSRVCGPCRRQEIPLVAWDAHITWFDVPHRTEGIPIDTSKGVILCVTYEWPFEIVLDTAKQRDVVHRMRQLLSEEVESISK